MMSSSRLLLASCAFGFTLLASSVAHAAPVPSGGHPRLWMSNAQLEAYKANIGKERQTSAAYQLKVCKESIQQEVKERGGADGGDWPAAALACAFSWKATGDQQYLTAALKYWHASLDDDETLGDKKGCVVGVNTNWQSWNGERPAPPILVTVTHDTGYPIRWYGPDVALLYDWLYDAPGVDEGLRAQTRTCLTAWVDWYSKMGYLRDQPGGNYNAGYVIAKVLAGIAIGNDGGADGHLWNDAVTLMLDNVIKIGLANPNGAVGTPSGVLVGGDWAEGWQYGSLSVLELAAAARALEEHGQPLPEMDAWANSLPVRLAHATVPDGSGNWVGGDFDEDEMIYAPIRSGMVDAVLLGPSSDTAASWIHHVKPNQEYPGLFIFNAIAETRALPPQDYRKQTPPPGLWYIARGTRAMFTRTSWEPNAFWATFTSQNHLVDDHQHFAATNFVFTRGADHLIVDSSNYGEGYSLETNALTADSPAITSERFIMSQTDHTEAELLWARGTTDAVYAARGDISRAFLFKGKTDITYGHREWVFLPEGEIVAIDRMHILGPQQNMYVGFHTNTMNGKLALNGNTAIGTVGGSQVAIHAVKLSSGAPTITQPKVGNCEEACAPCGRCDAARFPVEKYNVKVAGPWAVAIHAIDGLAQGEAPATVGSINDDSFDPAPKQNAGVIGAAVYRANKQSYVIASAGQDGVHAGPMTYGVPGQGPSRHIVFDAPEDNGKSVVSTAVQGDRCVMTITAGAGGFTGRPLMFTITSAAEGCKATEATDVAPGAAPTGGGVGLGESRPPNIVNNGSGEDDGCGCSTPKNQTGSVLLVGLTTLAVSLIRRVRRRHSN